MIELKNISKTINGEILLTRMTMQFEAGKSYALVGPSGSGKSTLLNMIATLEEPTTGNIFVEGKTVTQKNQRKFFKEKLGYLFQNYGLIDNQTIEENLMLALAYKKITTSEKQVMMRTLLKKMGIKRKLRTKIYTLSGGEQQRVALIRVMLKKPTLILADEPTGSLDEKNGKQIIDQLLMLKHSGATIIIATHDHLIADQCDHVIDLEDYKKEALGY